MVCRLTPSRRAAFALFSKALVGCRDHLDIHLYDIGLSHAFEFFVQEGTEGILCGLLIVYDQYVHYVHVLISPRTAMIVDYGIISGPVQGEITIDFYMKGCNMLFHGS